MATFSERLREALGPDGYDTCLRRSVQSVTLYEAKRILTQMEAQRTAENLASLRAFQRKYVYWEIAKAVLETTSLTPHERAQVWWKTATSKEPLGDETAWKRGRVIEKELKALADTIRPVFASHPDDDAAIDEFIRQSFVSTVQYTTLAGGNIVKDGNSGDAQRHFSPNFVFTGSIQSGKSSISESHVGILSQ